MERIFYFSGYRMTVFDWDGKQLFGSRDFQPDDFGFKEFEKLLAGSVKIPSRLLVDMIEEDFRRESIPHVGFMDRRAVIDRQLKRHYREEDYVHARVIGRSGVGRRDDEILLSALTNTGLLAPWLERLEEYEVQLAGIWSLPLLVEKLVKPLHAADEHVLIISRQVRSALRNTYLRGGKLLLSRQAKFDKDMWDRNDFEGVMTHLEKGATEIHTFLMNQRMMEPADQLQVYCILNDEQLTEAEILSHPSNQVNYHFISLETLFSQFDLKGCEGFGADALFSYLCTTKQRLYDHYGTRDQKANYRRSLVDRLVKNVTEIGSLVFIGLAVLLALKGMELNLQEENLSEDIVALQLENEILFGDIREELDNATYILGSVLLADRIGRDADLAPHEYFGLLGRVLGSPQYRDISLRQLEWQKYSIMDVQRMVSDFETAQTVQNPNAYVTQVVDIDPYDEDGFVLRQPVLNLRGEIDTDRSTYRQTISTMTQFVEELEADESVDRVLLIKTPADVRETARFSDQVGGETESGGVRTKSNAFEVMVVLKGLNSA